ARFDHGPAAMAPDKACDFALACGNRDNRATGRGDAVELAGHDQALELGPQRQPMHIGNAERLAERGALLIGLEAELRLELALAHQAGELLEPAAAADEQEDDPRLVAQPLGGGKERFELVPAAEIPRISHDEPVIEPPGLPQGIG